MRSPTQKPSPRLPGQAGAARRPRQAALILVLALVVLAVVHTAVGLAPPIFYGAGGGLLVSLLIVGLDWHRGSRDPSPDDDRRDGPHVENHTQR
jgi:hypothetical protein